MLRQAVLLPFLLLACATAGIRKFPDRPVAWEEHDDVHVPVAPARADWQKNLVTYGIDAFLVRESDRLFRLEPWLPAKDVNALDEVPCSTWFCPRNHLVPLSPDEVAAGPPRAEPPCPPFTVVEAHRVERLPGWLVVLDARGVRYMFKFDPLGSPGLSTGPEIVTQKLVYAAGYNVPGAFLLRVRPDEFRLSKTATVTLHGFEETSFTADRFRGFLAAVGRSDEGRIRVACIPWLPGQNVGVFDFQGTRADDPNDRIPHQHRRSLRASYVLFSWLGHVDVKPDNTLDAYVERAGRRFVRHFFVDFNSSLGAVTHRAKAPQRGQEWFVEMGRTLQAMASLGAVQRDWQRQRPPWESAWSDELGWFPDQDWQPDGFRTNLKVAAHLRMTDRDAYFGAKLVTSFSDEQIEAAVATAGYSERAGRALVHALERRRAAVGRRYLLPMTAVETPWLREGELCFRDLAVERGFLNPPTYEFAVRDEHGTLIASGLRPAIGATSCVPVPKTPYAVVSVRSRVGTSVAKAAYVHVRRRGAGFVVAGLERDE